MVLFRASGDGGGGSRNLSTIMRRSVGQHAETMKRSAEIAKLSLSKVFLVTLESGHRSMQSARLKDARNRLQRTYSVTSLIFHSTT
jgi:hypothetical protein